MVGALESILDFFGMRRTGRVGEIVSYDEYVSSRGLLLESEYNDIVADKSSESDEEICSGPRLGMQYLLAPSEVDVYFRVSRVLPQKSEAWKIIETIKLLKDKSRHQGLLRMSEEELSDVLVDVDIENNFVEDMKKMIAVVTKGSCENPDGPANRSSC